MAENIHIPTEIIDKEERYRLLVPQIRALVAGESDVIANLANIVAAIKFGMNFFWVGVYFVKDNELVLGPFQGPVACTRIAFGKGVCGVAWKERKVILVEDVDKFPGHIACSSLSKSEIVLPIFKQQEVVMVMDIDSEELNTFDAIDEQYLQTVCRLIETFL
ncbi:MAG: GAF domain-containing protein [Bacteroidota bacterium]